MPGYSMQTKKYFSVSPVLMISPILPRVQRVADAIKRVKYGAISVL
jgi:hypothetical protein